MNDVNGVGFNNCGYNSGASQIHKHLQFIPRESLPGHQCPLENYLLQTNDNYFKLGGLGTIPLYTFKHAIYYLHKLDLSSEKVHSERGSLLYNIYTELLKACNLSSPLTPILNENNLDIEISKAASPTASNEIFISYNVILTPDFMLLVPRKYSSYKGIHVNSLGFIGLLVAKNEDELALLSDITPIEILKAVTLTSYRT